MTSRFLIPCFLTASLFPAACGNDRPTSPETSQLAQIGLSNLDSDLDVDMVRLDVQSLERKDNQSFSFGLAENMQKTVKPGHYRLELTLFKGNQAKYSSNACTFEQQKSEVRELKPGPNQVNINICATASSETVVEGDSGDQSPKKAELEIDVTVVERKGKPDSSGKAFDLTREQLFVDTYSNARSALRDAQNRGADQQTLEALRYIADQPTFVWLSRNWLGGDKAIEKRVRDLTRDAGDKVLQLLIYDTPGRDCGQYSKGGVQDLAAYQKVIQEVINGLGNHKAMIILEPDALGLSVREDCDPSASEVAVKGIALAVEMLAPRNNIKVFLDASHADWLTVDQAVPLLKKAGIAKADGFVLNISNYVSTAKNKTFGQAISQQVGNKPFLIDSSRNGKGAWSGGGSESWCNLPDRALGYRPDFVNGEGNHAGYVWAKKPGESDGVCRGGLPAGQFDSEVAVQQYQEAKKLGLVP
jgi:endoglucanase